MNIQNFILASRKIIGSMRQLTRRVQKLKADALNIQDNIKIRKIRGQLGIGNKGK